MFEYEWMKIQKPCPRQQNETRLETLQYITGCYPGHMLHIAVFWPHL